LITQDLVYQPPIHEQANTMSHVSMKTRVDKLNPVLSSTIDRNNFEAASIINHDNMDIMMFQWNHSEVSLLHPGQEVEIIQFINDTEVRILHSILLTIHSTNSVIATGSQTPIATETAILKVGIKPTIYNIKER